MKRFSKTVVVILVILIFITALWAWKGELLPGGLPRFLPQKETAEETESLTVSEESVNSTESPTEETVPAALQEESGTEQEGQGTLLFHRKPAMRMGCWRKKNSSFTGRCCRQ